MEKCESYIKIVNIPSKNIRKCLDLKHTSTWASADTLEQSWCLPNVLLFHYLQLSAGHPNQIWIDRCKDARKIWGGTEPIFPQFVWGIIEWVLTRVANSTKVREHENALWQVRNLMSTIRTKGVMSVSQYAARKK